MLPALEQCEHLNPLEPSQAVRMVSDLGTHDDVAAVLSLLKSANTKCARITYNYGDLVVDNGTFRLPGIQSRLNQTSSMVNCAKCRTLNGRFDNDNPVPLLLNLDKPLEVFRIYTDVHGETRGYRTVPLAYRGPGELIGLFENLRPPKYPASYGSFYVSAGSRNVHLVLPLKDGTSTLLERAGLQKAFPHSQNIIRDAAQVMDRDEYRLPPKFTDSLPPKPIKLDGITGDWRIIRTVIGEPTWKASLMMILVDRKSVLEMADTALALFRAGFYQLQDALAAFTANGPPHGSDTRIFMNVDGASVPAVWNHLTACIRGKEFAHVPANRKDSKGPWDELFEAIAKRDSAEHEVRDLNYFPVILEPAKLVPSRAKGFVSFGHLLIPQVLFLSERPNDKWINDTQFQERLKQRGIETFTRAYPYSRERKSEESISVLKSGKPECWPDIEKKEDMLGTLSSIVAAANKGKLSRLTCLREFMTVRYGEPVKMMGRTGATPA